MTTKTATVTVTEDVTAGGTRLEAGTYTVRMPADYDAALVTGEDILMDGAITIVDGEAVSLRWIDEHGQHQTPGCTEEEATFASHEEAEAAIEDLRASDPATWGDAEFVIEAR